MKDRGFLVQRSEETERGRRLRIEIHEASPFFVGHFPGRPILPGIAHLALAAQALGEAAIAEVKFLKLRSPVAPGEVLDLAVETAEDRAAKFDLRRGGEPVSQGSLRLGGEAAPEETFEPGEPAGRFPSPELLIPHAPPARLVHEVLEISADAAICVVGIPNGNPFVEDGRAPAFVGLEAAAQTAAVLEALARTGTAGPKIGYLVGIRNARFHTPWLPVDVPLRATVRLQGSAPPLSIYEVSLDQGNESLLTGVISTYIDLSPTASGSRTTGAAGGGWPTPARRRGSAGPAPGRRGGWRCGRRGSGARMAQR